MMQPFNKIRGNYHIDFSKGFELAPRTAFIGPHETGKSSILQAASLALAGEPIATAPEDSPSSSATALTAHAVRGQPNLFVELSSSEGSFTLSATKKPRALVSRSVPTQGPWAAITTQTLSRCVPLAAFRQIVAAKTDNSAYDHLFGAFGVTAQDIEDPHGLTLDERQLWQNYLKEIAVNLLPHERLLELSKNLASARRAKNSERTKLGEVIATQRAVAAQNAPDPQMKHALETQLARARTWDAEATLRAQAAQLQIQIQNYGRAEVDREALNTQHSKIQTDLSTTQQQIDQLKDQLSQYNNYAQTGHILATYLEQANFEGCAICNSPGHTVKEAAQQNVKTINTNVDLWAEDAKKAQNKLAELQTLERLLIQQVQKIENQLIQTRPEFNWLQEQLEQIQKKLTLQSYSGASAYEIQQKLDVIAKMQGYEVAQNERAQRYTQMDSELLMLERLQEFADGERENARLRVTQTAQDTVRAYLDQADLDIRYNKGWQLKSRRTNDWRYAIEANGRDRVTLLLAVALAYSKQTAPFTLLTLDDSELGFCDSAAVADIIRWLSNLAVDQVLLASARIADVLPALQANQWAYYDFS